MIHPVRTPLFALLLILSASSLSAQVQTGTPPFGSFGGGPDTINLANLNVHLDVPVTRRAGRGTDFSYDLGYDSSVWYPVTSSGSLVWMPVGNWGWTSISQVVGGYVTFTTTSSTKDNGLCQIITSTNFKFFDIFGTAHPFPGSALNELWNGTDGQNTNCFSQTLSNVTALDGSGIVMSNDTFRSTIYSPDGISEKPPYGTPNGSTTVTDRNGNEITVTINSGTYTFTDTLGQTALTVTGSAPNPITFSYTAPSGATASYTMKFASYNVQTKFGCSSVTDYGTNGTTTANLVSEIDQPDGSKYTFQYESTPGVTGFVTGRLASVTLPTGGKISYTYTGGSSGHITCADGSASGLQRYTPDTGTSAFWNYARMSETGAAYITTVTDPTPQANQTLYQFQGIYETQRDIYAGAAPTISTFPIPESTLQTSNLLEEIQTCYNTNTTNCTSTAVSTPISQKNVTTLLSGASSWANAKTSQTILKFNPTGTLLAEEDFDFGTGSVGPLLKTTTYTYAPLTFITAFPSRTTVADGSGTTVSEASFAYGDTVTGTSGTPQHASPVGSRGNLLSVNLYTNSSTFLTKSFTYYDTGTPNTSTDVNGTVTTYSYAGTSCGNAFPTSISWTQPIAMSQSFAWNCAGAVPTSSTDVNGNSTSATYNDPNFWRPASFTDATKAVTNLTYTSPTQAESVLSFNSGGSAVDNLVTQDSLGRPLLTQVRQAPGANTFDSQKISYDSLGRQAQVSLPFAGAAGQTSPTMSAITTSYDALNRPLSVVDAGGGTVNYSYAQNDVLVAQDPPPTGENAKSRQMEYDGLGRLTSVCEISSAPGSGACGQANAKTGFLTKYTYSAPGTLNGVTLNAQASGSTQSRTYSYDLLGRLLSEANPESGTTAYTYDTDSTCGTSNSDLVKRLDAVGNVTCYSYDAFHRTIAVKYPSGSYASATASKFFVYDSATVDGVAMVNTKGRLAEAYTCSGSCTSKITDEGFSYTARGEISDQYQSSPNSAGFYHANYLYFPNGIIQQVSGLPTLPTFTYGVDGEGRIKTLSASAIAGQLNQNPLTGTTYNIAGQPTAVNFGSGDSDAYTYDPNTNRMKQYQFNVNTQAFVGDLAWNANGTLASQQTTDPFNSADTQNCNYSHDDLVRIASVNCGSTWTQTFSYDAFGNLSKNGSMMFQPTYNSATNRMTSIGTFTPTYDANGNVLNNSAHTYTWDAEGKYVSVDGVSVTYDALGRKVELGGASELLYLPDGAYILFKGQVARQGTLKLPGGGQAFYDANNGGLVQYSHADYLGSFRLASTPARGYLSSLAYAPFGEQYSAVDQGGADGFTGYTPFFAFDEYDFPARQFSDQGRWVSPDPAGLASVNLSVSQSWNRYAYALNSPMMNVDPLGLFIGVPCAINPASCSGAHGGGGGVGVFLPYKPSGEGGGGGGGNQQKKGDCQAQLRSRPGDITSVGGHGFWHAWWYVTNASGQNYTISFTGSPAIVTVPTSAGPAPFYVPFTYLNAYVAQGPQSSSNPGDNVQNKKATLNFDSGWSAANCDGVNAMLNAAWNFPNNQVLYGPATSNSGARYLGNISGFSPAQPPGTGGIGGWNVLIPGVEQ